jgi:hypothetical protein
MRHNTAWRISVEPAFYRVACCNPLSRRAYPRAGFVLSGRGHGLHRPYSRSGLLRYELAQIMRRRGRRRDHWAGPGSERKQSRGSLALVEITGSFET